MQAFISIPPKLGILHYNRRIAVAAGLKISPTTKMSTEQIK
jgi:hypothetical protein